MSNFYKKTLKSSMQAWLTLTLFLINIDVQANISPPYPEVWGYDLSSYPAFRSDGGSIDAYRLADNDIGFLILTDYKVYNSLSKTDIQESRKYMLLHFFTGEKEYLSYAKWSIFIEEMYTKKISNEYQGLVANFKDTSNIEIIFHRAPKLCSMPEYLQSEIVKKNNNQQEHYLILGRYNTAYIQQDRALCDICSAPFFYANLYNLGEKIIDLKDDSFIAYNSGGNLLLRLDKNLQTKFKSETTFKFYNSNFIDRNFFILDYNEAMNRYNNISNKNQLPYYQTINNNLLIWLQKNMR